MDQIADLLTRIRNTALTGGDKVSISYSRIKEAILKILKDEGFISDFEITDENGKKIISAIISRSKKPSHLRQLSKPGKRVYAKNKEIPSPLRGLGTVIISTSAGITTGKAAKKNGLGGELICEIW